MDNKTKEITKAYDAAHQLKRIADSLKEILLLVKQDMERMKKLNEEPEEGDMRDHFTKATIND